ncbi:MAG TPA: hypothetical protein VFW09_02475 [Solirubrobacteraceae bacterium]|nr:hypothetical protein [Solirubrobacteraceae bacterium]
MRSDASASAPMAEHSRRESDRAGVRGPGAARLFGGGTDGNERLTVLTGSLLVVLTAAVGVTIIRIGQLMWLHLFLGLVLAGPVALKLASTGYRFVRYYTHDPAYRAKGPPLPLLRGLAPLVVLSTLALFATGIALLFAGRNTGLPLGLLHKVSFILWIALVALHVLGHLPEIVRALPRARQTRRAMLAVGLDPDRARLPRAAAGAGGRLLALGIGVAAGLVLAVALIGQFSIWTG